jgi:hypothetical protein
MLSKEVVEKIKEELTAFFGFWACEHYTLWLVR